MSVIFAAVMVCTLVLLSGCSPSSNTYMIPAHIAEAMSKAEPIQNAIEEYRRSHGRFPASAAELQNAYSIEHQYVSDVQITDSGAISLTFSGYMQEIEGKGITLTPTAEEGGSVRWNCGSKDIPARLLPSSCR